MVVYISTRFGHWLKIKHLHKNKESFWYQEHTINELRKLQVSQAAEKVSYQERLSLDFIRNSIKHNHSWNSLENQLTKIVEIKDEKLLVNFRIDSVMGAVRLRLKSHW